MIVRFRLDCDHKRVSLSIPRAFNHTSVQQVGTYIQDAHSALSVKVKSRSSSKIRTVNDTTTSNLKVPIGTSSPKKDKVFTNCPYIRDDACSFNFFIICRNIDNKWYLR